MSLLLSSKKGANYRFQTRRDYFHLSTHKLIFSVFLTNRNIKYREIIVCGTDLLLLVARRTKMKPWLFVTFNGKVGV